MTAVRIAFLVAIALPAVAFFFLLCAPKEFGVVMRELGLNWQRLKTVMKAHALALSLLSFASWQPQAEMSLVNSSFIHSIGYDEWRSCLLVEMDSGQRYGYFGFGPVDYKYFRDADSKGEYFNHRIKAKNHDFQRLWF